MAFADDLENEYPEIPISEQIPGDHVDISGFDPLDFGDSEASQAPFEGDVAQEFWSEEDKDNLREQPQTNTQPAVKAPQKSDNAAFARARVLERDNRILRERFDALLSAIQQGNSQKSEEEEEEIVPFEEDPLAYLASRVSKLDQKLDYQTLEQQKQAEIARTGALLQRADELTNDAISKVGPELWDQATAYLAKVRIDDYCERNPQYTREEADKIIGQAILQEKIRIVESGRNPAEVYLRDAFRFGFRPPANQAALAPARTQAKAPVQKADHRTDIRKANEKEARGGKTIGGVRGSAPQNRLSAQAILGMDDRQFRDQIDDVMKERGASSLRLRDFIAPN